jgi:hypothetical protein
MTTRYFPSASEAYRKVSLQMEDPKERYANYRVTRATSGYYFVRAYNELGEFQGVLQEDGSFKNDDDHIPHGSL